MSDILQPVRLEDYQPPSYLVDQVDLHLQLDPDRTLVRSRLRLRANPLAEPGDGSLRLDGRNLELLSIAVDGCRLDETAYRCDDEGLILEALPGNCEVESLVAIAPAANTALEGLYLSGGIYCTQCEPEGFRKITFYPDRPDVMARFRTTLVADPGRCPVLLANGNLESSRRLADGRQEVVYDDPFPKPSYLFALVAGRLTAIEDRFTTASGREVRLQIFVEERNRTKCEHAMRSLKNAMRWDEQTYGLECDLDEYKIVAVDDFNMGAMENKGLNIFNSKYVLARPETATDADFQAIEGVVGHEYFHNWTGNRVTCRDWFQLSLKEGLTVFRDQEFSADMGSRPVKRIADVRLLRNAQFPEDAGPMAHPVRPESYIEINNFYTATVYHKGAELIRMYQTLLGGDDFKRGLKLYLDRHDGQAVTTDDFLAAMADASGLDLEQFRRWYSQAGTPVVQVTGEFDPSAREFRLHVTQACPPTPGQPDKQPLLIPLAVGLIDPQGNELPLQLEGESEPGAGRRVLPVTSAAQTFVFVNVGEAPLPSLLGGFSAPVKLDYPYSDPDLAFLLAQDRDPFNRWEAGQRLATRLLLKTTEAMGRGDSVELPELYREAFRATLTERESDPALLALALTLPSETELAEALAVADPEGVHRARQGLRRDLARALAKEFQQVFTAMQDRGIYQLTAAAIGRRSLKNLCLAYLCLLETEEIAATCFRQFVEADNMTDRFAALACLAHGELPQREEALAAFYHQYQDVPLVVDKWFSLQATSPRPDALAQVRELTAHPAFTLRNPNRARALVGAFAHGNPYHFHAPSGEGYRFVAEQVMQLDPFNPQTAAGLVVPLSRWRRYDEHRQGLMRAELELIQKRPDLSRDVGEIVAKSLAEPA